MIAALTGVSTVSGLGTNRAHAAPGDKTPAGEYVPLAEKGVASGVATLDADSKIPSAQLPNLSASFVGKGELVINAKDYGAVGDGVVDDTVALNDAAAAAVSINAESVLFIPTGLYRTSRTVTIKCALRGEAATIRYYGTGEALVIGNQSSPNIVTARRSFRLPRVINMQRTTGWDGTSVGVKLVNLNTCDIYVPFVQDFEHGLVLYGNGGGSAYNTVFLGALWENHKNLVLDCTADGYTNQNQFFGGRLQHSATKGATLDDANASQIYMVSMNLEGGPNNNSFIGTSFEGENVAYYRVDIAGRYNQFYNCRWEHRVGQNPRVRYRSTARFNKIEGGYASVDLIEVFDGTLGGGEIRDHVGAYSAAGNTSGQVIPNNVWTDITSWNPPVQRRVTYDGAGNFRPRPGRWRIAATVTFAPNATGRRIARLNVGGSVVDIAEAPGSALRNTLKVEGVCIFDSVKTFKVQCNQTSGTDLALETTPAYVQIQAEYLGY